MVLQVRAAGANPEAGQADLPAIARGQVVIGMCDPLGDPQTGCASWPPAGVSLFALELLPRITRAQSMDVLSSQATIAGYRAVLLGADGLAEDVSHDDYGRRHAQRRQGLRRRGRAWPACRPSPRPGGWAAIVSAYDVRPAVKEQVQSLGAKFVEMRLETAAAETKGGYAQQMDEEFYRKQRELMLRVVAESDVVITTAAVPGKKAPVLVTAEMVGQDGRRAR